MEDKLKQQEALDKLACLGQQFELPLESSVVPDDGKVVSALLRAGEPGILKFDEGEVVPGLVRAVESSKGILKSDVGPEGGPSSYYDMPFSGWVTTNDQMEYLALNKWKEYSIHLKDVFKALCRWGDKKGTSHLYDAKKGIYYFCRVVLMIGGKDEVRSYLKELLNDKQFGGKS